MKRGPTAPTATGSILPVRVRVLPRRPTKAEVQDEQERYLLDVGDRVVSCRLRLRLTQAELAERAGVSVRQVRDLERGTGNTSLTTLVRIASALGLPPEDLGGVRPSLLQATARAAAELVDLHGSIETARAILHSRPKKRSQRG